jgi:hypothetical protein
MDFLDRSVVNVTETSATSSDGVSGRLMVACDPNKLLVGRSYAHCVQTAVKSRFQVPDTVPAHQRLGRSRLTWNLQGCLGIQLVEIPHGCLTKSLW